jgi:hypothetical protein
MEDCPLSRCLRPQISFMHPNPNLQNQLDAHNKDLNDQVAAHWPEIQRVMPKIALRQAKQLKNAPDPAEALKRQKPLLIECLRAIENKKGVQHRRVNSRTPRKVTPKIMLPSRYETEVTIEELVHFYLVHTPWKNVKTLWPGFFDFLESIDQMDLRQRNILKPSGRGTGVYEFEGRRGRLHITEGNFIKTASRLAQRGIESEKGRKSAGGLAFAVFA